MTQHLQRELEGLKKKLLNLCAAVDVSLNRAVGALGKRDQALARRIEEVDIDIDCMEIDVEEECLKILALHQPVAADLRLVVAVLKINNDLERIGDLAVNIAEQAYTLETQDLKDVPHEIPDMCAKVKLMLKNSLKALLNLDEKLACDVCIADDEVDEYHRRMFEVVMDAIRTHPERMDRWIRLLSISRYLERIADHATNIAEDVIYMIEGEIVRHAQSPKHKKP